MWYSCLNFVFFALMRIIFIFMRSHFMSTMSTITMELVNHVMCQHIHIWHFSYLATSNKIRIKIKTIYFYLIKISLYICVIHTSFKPNYLTPFSYPSTYINMKRQINMCFFMSMSCILKWFDNKHFSSSSP